MLPELDGKLDGGAQRVPVKSGSLTEVTAVLNEAVTAEDAANGAYADGELPRCGLLLELWARFWGHEVSATESKLSQAT